MKWREEIRAKWGELLLLSLLLSIIFMLYYFAWLSGGMFGECWHISGNPSNPDYQECLRNLG